MKKLNFKKVLHTSLVIFILTTNNNANAAGNIFDEVAGRVTIWGTKAVTSIRSFGVSDKEICKQLDIRPENCSPEDIYATKELLACMGKFSSRLIAKYGLNPKDNEMSWIDLKLAEIMPDLCRIKSAGSTAVKFLITDNKTLKETMSTILQFIKENKVAISVGTGVGLAAITTGTIATYLATRALYRKIFSKKEQK
ncbi:MAG: hypothetical protein SZ59_C0001G0124 [candidate division TM6 bacterium GW2011_GWF2_28_16]|nr:MAG: hypothetical protein SZ59_C0001G0124 [candidate division TM6 bacterium GW2011_GWF2_28_16]